MDIRELGEPENADWFWDDRDLSHAWEDLEQAIENDDVGDVIELRPLIELPTIRVKVLEDGYGILSGPVAE